MSAQTPLVSVIVPVWNAEATLRDCLHALRAQTLPPEVVELIVVDNGSTDGTGAILATVPGLVRLSEPRPGSYAARNTGLRAARGEYVAFTDADCVPQADWLEQALAAARAHPGAGIIGGRIELFGLDGDSMLCRHYEQVLGFDQRRYVARGHCATANWLSPRALLAQIGGFDAALKSGGDFELARRIRTAGRRLVYAETMIVRHPCRGSVGGLLAKRRRTAGGQWPQQRGLRARLKYVLGIGWQVQVESRRLLAEAALPLGHRLRLCGLSAMLAGGQLVELGRLSLGGEPRRA